jgi:hypothetical protein
MSMGVKVTRDKATAIKDLQDRVKELKSQLKSMGDPNRSPKAAEVRGQIDALNSAVRTIKTIQDPAPANVVDGNTQTAVAADIV